MSTVADAFDSTAARPVRLRLRKDLKVRRHVYRSRPYWMIKEPVGLKYFRVNDEEYDVLQLLDGRRSMEEIKDEFERRRAPQTVTLQQLQSFLGNAHRNGLVISDAAGQGEQLWLRRRKARRKKILSTLASILWVRFRGFDPTRILDALYPWTHWIFSRRTVIFSALLGLSALILLGVQFEAFMARLPAFHKFFGTGNWLLLGLTLAGTKVLHELGHGLSCKKVGGECHEIGFMLLVFTPALYCNVSDSWMEPNKWKRAAVGAAGMYVELILASIATFLWWFSEPGLLNHVCLNIMFICSVSTVLFNGNPLLRFDGYFILADLVEIPNMRQKGSQVLRRSLLWWFAGIDLPDDPYLPRRRVFLGAYSVAAAVYRWFVVLSIFLFLNAVLKPYGLQIFGRMLAAASLFGLVILPCWQMIKFFRVPGRVHEVKKKRLLISVTLAVTAIVVVLSIPLPYYVTCSFTIQPEDAVSVYVVTPGQLQQIDVEPGQDVDAGMQIAQLENIELKQAVQDLERDRDRLANSIELLQLRLHHDEDAGFDEASMRESLKAIETQLTAKKDRMEKLTITSPQSGAVYPAASRSEQPAEDTQLSEWSGWALDKKNLGAALAEGTLVCQIGHPQRWEALLVIDQADVDFLAAGSTAKLQLESRPGTPLSGELQEISTNELEFVPHSLTREQGGDVETAPDARGAARSSSTVYQARVKFDSQQHDLQAGLRGKAKIRAGSRSLGNRAWRYLTHTFHFEL